MEICDATVLQLTVDHTCFAGIVATGRHDSVFCFEELLAGAAGVPEDAQPASEANAPESKILLSNDLALA